MTDNRSNRIVTRRRFLQASSVFALAVGIAAALKREPIRLLYRKLRYGLNPYVLDKASPAGRLSPEQVKNLVDFAFALISWPEPTKEATDSIQEYVQGKCEYQNGARQEYVNTAELLDRKSKSHFNEVRFYNLNRNQQQQIVSQFMPPPIHSRKSGRHVYNLFFEYDGTRITELIANDLLTFFYSTDQSLVFLQKG